MRMYIRTLVASILFTLPINSQELPKNPDSALVRIPADTTILIHVHGLELVKEKLKQVLVPTKVMTEKEVDDLFGEMLDGRKIQSLRKDGRIVLAINSLFQPLEKMEFTLFLPCASIDKLKRELLTSEELKLSGKDNDLDKIQFEIFSLFAVEIPDYVVLSTHAETAKSCRDRPVVQLPEIVAGNIYSQIIENDISVCFATKQINQLYQAEIKPIRDAVATLLAGGLKDLQIRGVSSGQLELSRTLFGEAIRLSNTCSALVASIKFEKDALQLSITGNLPANSPAPKTIAHGPREVLQLLESQPKLFELNSVTSYRTIGYESASASLGALQMRSSNDQTNEVFRKLFSKLNQAQIAPAVNAGNLLNPHSIKVYQFSDANDALGILEHLFSATDSNTWISGYRLKGPATKAEKKVPLAEKDFTHWTLPLNLDAMVTAEEATDPTSRKQELLQALAGKEFMELYYRVEGKKLVLVVAPDVATAAKWVQQLDLGKATLANDPMFQLIAGKLPSDSQILATFESAAVQKWVSNAKLPTPQGYLGLAVRETPGQFQIICRFHPTLLPYVQQLMKLPETPLKK
ncbi:MAG: hypothetical protein R3B84_05015 [Zavarzinella sp.]